MIIFTVLLLALMEISLSFDNAVLNAGVLKDMSPKWQHRFLTYGMPVAVFGMRLIFPIGIVAIASGLGFMEVTHLAIKEPAAYATELAKSHISISAFGGMFLLMVFLNFMLNPGGEREVFWLTWIEQKLAKLGLLKGVEIVIALIALITVASFTQNDTDYIRCVLAGLVGLGLYIVIDAVTGMLDLGDSPQLKGGIASFIYLEILDASCSLDGVIGAFVLTDNIFLIMLGLGLGAFAIRSLTLYLVRGGFLQEYIYLEHGAHYGIGALATIMLVSTFYPVPEPVTGCLGMLFIVLSLISSIRKNRRGD